MKTIKISQFELGNFLNGNYVPEVVDTIRQLFLQHGVIISDNSQVRLRQSRTAEGQGLELTIKNDKQKFAEAKNVKTLDEHNLQLPTLLDDLVETPVSGMVQKTRMYIHELAAFESIMNGLEFDHAVLDLIDYGEGGVMPSIDIEFQSEEQALAYIQEQERIRWEVSELFGHNFQINFIGQKPKERGRELWSSQNMKTADMIAYIQKRAPSQELAQAA